MQETLSVTVAGGSIKTAIQAHPDLWTSPYRYTGKKLHSELADLWVSETAALDHAQLMMSAGWDSGAILAGIISNGLQDTLLAYSHGDREGRELRIASDICRDAGVTHIKAPLAEELFSEDAADSILAETDTPGGHLKFPHLWPGQNPPVDGDGTVCVYAL